MSKLLIVDDELSMREMLEIFFRKAGHEVRTASGGDAGIAKLDEEEFDLVITDLRMPRTSGMSVLRNSRERHPDTPVIVMTAYASTETAIEAMKAGAYDYFTKPFKLDVVQATIAKALEKRRLVLENRRLRNQLQGSFGFENIIGKSRSMREVFDLIRRVARARTNVLVLGESGTGKELVARALHHQSDRAKQPFQVVNCGAIPENLLESELFGHKRGAFTGAATDKVGLFQAATGGTLFLDEIGELPLAMQVKLLRVLQERRVKAVGDVREVAVDVRVIAATNRVLEEEVQAGRFRGDLYYRLNVICVELPPLRDRPEDIPLLAHHFLKQYAAELGKPIEDFSPKTMTCLMQHTYAGNVRELENIIEHACTLEDGHEIEPTSLPAGLRRLNATGHQAPTELQVPPSGIDLDNAVEDLERRLITQALEHTGGLKKEAARLLGISFRSLRYRVSKLGISVEPSDTSHRPGQR